MKLILATLPILKLTVFPKIMACNSLKIRSRWLILVGKPPSSRWMSFSKAFHTLLNFVSEAGKSR